MYYLCICQQPDNSDLFRGHGLGYPGGPYGLSYSGGLAQVGEKAQRWKGGGGGVFKSVRTPCQT